MSNDSPSQELDLPKGVGKKADHTRLAEEGQARVDASSSPHNLFQ